MWVEVMWSVLIAPFAGRDAQPLPAPRSVKNARPVVRGVLRASRALPPSSSRARNLSLMRAPGCSAPTIGAVAPPRSRRRGAKRPSGWRTAPGGNGRRRSARLGAPGRPTPAPGLPPKIAATGGRAPPTGTIALPAARRPRPTTTRKATRALSGIGGAARRPATMREAIASSRETEGHSGRRCCRAYGNGKVSVRMSRP